MFSKPIFFISLNILFLLQKVNLIFLSITFFIFFSHFLSKIVTMLYSELTSILIVIIFLRQITAERDATIELFSVFNRAGNKPSRRLKNYEEVS